MSKTQDMFDKLEELCESIEEDLKREETKGLTLTLKYKTADFKVDISSRIDKCIS